MNKTETLNWIHSFKAKGRQADLKRMNWLLEKLGKPQTTFPAIHIVGTNGKGSTCSYLQHILTASGYKTGSFTSPYITRFNERIAIDGKEISDQDLNKVISLVKPIVESVTVETHYEKVTEFELVTLLMFTYFAQINPVDIAIIEAGIGGLKDSTNVFKALAVVCPSISFDHQEKLGNSLAQIAQQKVGVLDEKVPFIFGQMTSAVKQVFYEETQLLGCPTFECNKDFSFKENGKAFDFIYQDFLISAIHLKMLGQHQKANASLAIMTSLILAKVFPNINSKTIRTGLQSTIWPGRCELLQANLLLDGAHNIDAITKLIQVLKDSFGDKTIHILFAGLKRKPIEKMLAQLAEFDLSVTSFDFFEALPLENYPLSYPRVDNWKNWITQATAHSDHLYVVTGSFYFISQVRNHLIKKTRLQ